MTVPSTLANRVSSPPRPTPSPGWMRVPRWRTRIVPAVTSWPPWRLTPSRLAAESRPLRLEDAPFLCAISAFLFLLVLLLGLLGVAGPGRPLAAAKVDGLDLEPGQGLAVAEGAALAGLVLVGEDADLGAPVVVDHAGRDLGLGQVGGGRGHVAVVVDDQQRLQLEAGTVVAAELLDVDEVADLHLVLLPAGADDGVHLGSSFQHGGGVRQGRRSADRQGYWISWVITTPRPSQVGQVSEKLSSRPPETRLRVIWTRPSEETSITWLLVLSLARAARRRSTTACWLRSNSMSMKSMMMIPPMSRRRSWRTISSAASRLLATTVSSRLALPTNLPVLTSITVMASVRSITIEPPEGSHTLRSSALWICSTTR